MAAETGNQGRPSPKSHDATFPLPFLHPPSPSPFPSFPLFSFSSPPLSLLFPSLPLEVGPTQIQLWGLGERCELPQRGLAEPQPKSNLVHFRPQNMTSGGNNFKLCPPTSLFLSPPGISVTHFASPGVPLDAPAGNTYISETVRGSIKIPTAKKWGLRPRRAQKSKWVQQRSTTRNSDMTAILYCPVSEILQVFCWEERPQPYSTRILGVFSLV